MRNTTSGKGKGDNNKSFAEAKKYRSAKSGAFVKSTSLKNKPSDTVRETTAVRPAIRSTSNGYQKLVKAFPLLPITNAKDNSQALAIVTALMNDKNLDREEKGYCDVLCMLIEQYETKAVPRGPKPTSGQMLDFLMEQHSIKQADLVDVLGSQTTVSLILNDKRKPTTEQIEALSKRFHVSPAVFFL